MLDPLADASTLKADVIRGLDLMIVRESTGGIYFGEPRGVSRRCPTASSAGLTPRAIPRTRSSGWRASPLSSRASGRTGCSVDKANVMQSGLFWRQTVTALREREFPEVDLTHMYADNCAMQLVRNPRQFDVIVTSNLFGDLLSDLASMLTGSLGMLPSATLGGAGLPASGMRCMSRSMAARRTSPARASPTRWPDYSASPCCCGTRSGWTKTPRLIERACVNVLKNGLRTADIMAPGSARVGTGVMGESILRELDKLAA